MSDGTPPVPEYKDAITEGMKMMAVPMGKLPPVAVEYARRLCNQVGMCMEVLLTAWIVYQQIVENLPCDDSLYYPTQDAIDWYQEQGYFYSGKKQGKTNEELLKEERDAIARQAFEDSEDLDGGEYALRDAIGDDEVKIAEDLELGEPIICAKEDNSVSHYGTKEWEGEVFSSCYKQCPLFQTSMDGMECGHPSFKGNPDSFACMIISHLDDIQGGFPPLCPLFKESK